jgi:hypothetical protein
MLRRLWSVSIVRVRVTIGVNRPIQTAERSKANDDLAYAPLHITCRTLFRNAHVSTREYYHKSLGAMGDTRPDRPRGRNNYCWPKENW